MDLVGKATRNEFREVLVGFVLRDIEMFFDGAGLACNEDYNPPLSRARRSLVERYYANIDFSSPSDIKKLLAAYGEIVLGLNRSGFSDTTKDNLLRLMKRDGYEFDGETFVALPSKQQPPIEAIRSLASSFDLPGLHLEIDRIARAAEEDPSLAVGTAKEYGGDDLQDQESPNCVISMGLGTAVMVASSVSSLGTPSSQLERLRLCVPSYWKRIWNAHRQVLLQE